MPLSTDEKDDVISTVLIELERMFTVLRIRFSPDHCDQALLLEKINAAFKESLIKID